MPNHPESWRVNKKGLVLILALALIAAASLSSSFTAENNQVVKANYTLAAQWTSQKVGRLVFDTAVAPRWLETGDRFWYTYQTPRGRNFYLVDPVKRSKTLLFDNSKMAAILTAITRNPYDGQHLPFSTVRFVKKDTAIQFQFNVARDADVIVPKKAEQQVEKKEQTQQTEQTQGQRGGRGGQPGQPATPPRTLLFEYDLTTAKLQLLEDNYRAPQGKPAWASISPDQKAIIFSRNHNLYMMDDVNYEKAKKNANDTSIVETQLTTDGEQYYSFRGRGGRGGGQQLEEMTTTQSESQAEGRGSNVRTPPITIYWSKDSKKFAVMRTDQRKVADLWVINSLGSTSNPRPILNTYRYAMPGEVNVPQNEILSFDRDTKARMKIKADAWKDQNLSIVPAPVSPLFREQNPDRTEETWFTDAPDKIYFTRISRDMHRYDVCVANPETGEVKPVVEERLNTYIDFKAPRLINNSQEFIWWSERDGWGHWYLYDINGTLKNQITSGEFVSDAIRGVDEKTRTLFFTAMGREPGEDPYYSHLYRVNLDGTGVKLMDPGEASHAVSASESARYFVDNSSRVNTPPHSVLYDSAGAMVLDLETTDVKALMEHGFKFPEPFKVKAEDGITDIYGVMFKPFDFDPNKKYPIILLVYPGPQTESVTKAFSPRSPQMWLAQFGFIVIEVGNRGGNPQRSKWYHTYSYGEERSFRDYGLADKKTAVEQLAKRYPFIDIDKVGIYGHSGGGFMSTAAMLVYPDFFKVAVSSSGNHENNIYNQEWSEKYHGVKEVTDEKGNVRFEYTMDKNSELAKNLKGRLLITTGDFDSNVHPANTFRLANALIQANKRFDMMVFPGRLHAYGDDQEYFTWIRADYFCKWLIGDFSSSVDLVELARDREQSGRPAAGTTEGGRGGGRRGN